jgi:WAS/WASL-interacting protein
MNDSQDSDERARLERYLEWRRAEGRDRRATGARWLFYAAGTVIVGLVLAASVTLMTARARDTRQRVASASRRAPVDSLARRSDDARAPVPRAMPSTSPANASRAEKFDENADGASAVPTPPKARERVATPRPARPERAAPMSARGDRSLPHPAAPAAPQAVAGARPEAKDGKEVVVVVAPAQRSATASSAPEESPAPPPEMANPIVTVLPPPSPRRDATPEPVPSPAASPARVSVTDKPIAVEPGSDTLDTIKRYVGYIPEVRLGKAIVGWVKRHPAAAPAPREAERPSPQSR